MSLAHLHMARYHDGQCGVDHRLWTKTVLVQSDSSVSELTAPFLIHQVGTVTLLML